MNFAWNVEFPILDLDLVKLYWIHVPISKFWADKEKYFINE